MAGGWVVVSGHRGCSAKIELSGTFNAARLARSTVIIMLSILLLLICSTRGIPDDFICDYYIAPSKYLGIGVGVFAGRHFVKDERSPTNVCLAFHRENSDVWQLKYYEFAPIYADIEQPHNAVLELGPTSLLNHHSYSHVETFYEDDHFINSEDEILLQINLFQELHPNTVYPRVYMQFLRQTEAGDEIFNYYSDGWLERNGFKDLKTSLDKIPGYTLEELRRIGHCLSLTEVQDSVIDGAALGVFARVDIEVGEIVQVAPVLVHLKADLMRASDASSVLINYCISHVDSEVTLLPLGTIALCNHAVENANVEMEWFSWTPETANQTLHQGLGRLRKAPSAKLYLAYRAVKRIAKGEEVLLNYGTGWVQAWEQHKERLRTFRLFNDPIPLFRRAIGAPEGLFPPHWIERK